MEGFVSPARETLTRGHAMKKLAPEPITPLNTNQTPFARFTAAASAIFSVPKSSLPKPTKKSRKK
jgi:hypothetical protein